LKVDTRYAGFWRRFLAAIIDGVVIFGVAIFSALMFEMMTIFSFSDEDGEVTLIGYSMALLFFPWIYHAFMESSIHQATFGKMAMGIMVTDIQGDRITFARASGRYFAKYLSYVTIYIGFIISAFTARKQALHDLIADTLVVVKT
jgi:uncharacterized RDD family membrane protein YckC